MPRSDTRFPPIDALRAFEAATRLGSFEQVAAELAITASAVSKRITALEHLLGVALFDRAGRRLVLTAAGKEYAEQVRAALNQLAAVGLHQRTAQSLPRLRVLSRGRLRIRKIKHGKRFAAAVHVLNCPLNPWPARR